MANVFSLRGFITISAFANNTVGVVAELGELSPLGRSFSREVGSYVSSSAPDVKLLSFYSLADGVQVETEPDYTNPTLAISQWLYTKSIQGVLTDDTNAALTMLQAEFHSTVTVKSMGVMKTNGRYWLPSSVEFTVLSAPDAENVLKVWYADKSFTSECDDETTVVAPTLDNLNDFFLDPTTVITKIKAITPESHNTQINKYRGDFPETRQMTVSYDWINPLNPADAHPVPFSSYIYGIAGINLDINRQHLIDFLIENSDHTEEEWAERFPDLFTPTELVIIPFWDKYSIPDLTDEVQMYSPSIPYVNYLPTIKKYASLPAYTDAAINESLVQTGNIWKSIAFGVIGHPRNRLASNKFNIVWPQYAIVAPKSIEFNKIDPTTQLFMTQLQDLLLASESATAFSPLKQQFTRVTRNGHVYLTMSFARVNYLCAIKQNFVSA